MMGNSLVKFVCFVGLLVSEPIAAQDVLNQQISLAKGEASIREVLKAVEKQSGIGFIYDSQKIEALKSVHLKKSAYRIGELLEEILGKENVQFVVRGNQVILRKQESRKSEKKTTATVYGYVRDEESGENMLGTSVVDLRSGHGTIANYYGYYSLTLPKGEVDLQFSFVGSKTKNVRTILFRDSSINVAMAADQLALEEVVVLSNRPVPVEQTVTMSTIKLTSNQIQSQPAIGGEVDVAKTLQLLPGVQSGVEGSAGLYVRGGGPDQNLILLDGVPVYNTSHLFGFSSVFNVDAINNVELIKGAFPARYGGRLSSVIEMSMKEGNAHSLKGAANISPIASSLMLEGPLARNKSSFMVAARRSFLDLLTSSFTDNSYYFYDLNLKLNHRFSERDRVYFSSYLGRDAGELNESQSWVEEVGTERIVSETRTSSQVDWHSAISLLRWNHVFNPKLFTNLSLSYSTYDFAATNNFFSQTRSVADTLTEYQQFNTTSDISDVTARVDFDIFPHPDHTIKLGVQTVWHQFKPNVVGLIASEQPDVTFNGSNVHTQEYNVYFEDDFKVSRKLRANLGIHASALQVSDAFYTSLQPRIALRWLLNDHLSLKSSYSEMVQFLHLLTNPGLGLPTDLWVPVTDQVGPQKSRHYGIGVARSFPTLGMEVTLEGYFKRMRGLIEYKDGANFLRLNEDWQDKVNTGRGESYGAELFVNRTWNRFEGWLGYTLAWSNRKFDDINFGRRFPYKYDRRHDVSLALTHHVSSKIQLSTNWVYGTGIAITLPAAKYQSVSTVIGEESFSDPTPILNYESRNGYRQRPSHRLDFSARFLRKKNKTERYWVFTVYNVYNRRNPVFIEARPTQDFDGLDWNLRFKEYSFLSIIPSVTYRLRF